MQSCVNYLHGKDAIMCGQMHNLTATEEYENETSDTVVSTGIILLPYWYPGCSLDDTIFAKVASPRLLEIFEVKCRFMHRNKHFKEILHDELKGKRSRKWFNLTSKGELNRNHIYWHQAQGRNSCCRCAVSRFAVWTW